VAEFNATSTILLDREGVWRSVTELAKRLAPTLDNDTIVVCLLMGGLWFAADMTRALAEEGLDLGFDALWLTSYGDAHSSSGSCERLAGPQRAVDGRSVLILDDVVDSGLSLQEASRLLREAGASRVTTAVFARKPWPTARALEPDYAAWEAPARFLVGYGLDAAGRLRALPHVAALD
jgi:hypoxanthine phosphoribosyltransferase